jgi:hypothetical protein
MKNLTQVKMQKNLLVLKNCILDFLEHEKYSLIEISQIQHELNFILFENHLKDYLLRKNFKTAILKNYILNLKTNLTNYTINYYFGE